MVSQRSDLSIEAMLFMATEQALKELQRDMDIANKQHAEMKETLKKNELETNKQRIILLGLIISISILALQILWIVLNGC